MGSRLVLVVLAASLLGTTLVPQTSADCHDVPPGCLPCPDQFDELNIRCAAPDLDTVATGGALRGAFIGRIAGLVVSGSAAWGDPYEGTPKEGAAYVDLTFEPDDPPAMPANVTLHVLFADQTEVTWRTAGDHTFNTTTNATVAFRYHFAVADGRHVHLPLAILAHEGSDHEERLEGELDLDEEKEEGLASMFAASWPFLLGSLVVGVVVGTLVGRRTR